MAKKKEPREPDVLPGKCFVVLMRNWGYNDEYHYPEGEGGAPQAVYSSRNEANIICDRLNLRDRAATEDLFDFFEEGQRNYDEMIEMEWPAWHDKLMDNGVTPPTESQEPDHSDLWDWWREGFGERIYSLEAKGMVPNPRNPGLWSEEQRTEAARYVNVYFYEVMETVADPDIFPPVPK